MILSINLCDESGITLLLIILLSFFAIQNPFASSFVPMNNKPLPLPLIALPSPLPLYLPEPRFQIGQWVYWKHFQDDFGYIGGVCWAAESSVKMVGFHYLVLLDPSSTSKHLGVDLDYAFQDDLTLMMPKRSPA